MRNELCAIRWSWVESARLFLKMFWKSQLLQWLHLYPRRRDQDMGTRVRVYPIMHRLAYCREDRNCAAIKLSFDGVYCSLTKAVE